MIARAILKCGMIGGVALADPPTGYRCGEGKPNPGKGCTCPSGFTEKRDGDGTATCAASSTGTATSPCEVLAERVAALWGGTGAARERRLVLDSCSHDRWSGDALRCEREKTREKLTACLKGKLTGDQEKTFESSRDALFERIEAEVGVSDKAIGKRFALFVGRTAKLDDMAAIWISAIADKLIALKDIEQVEIQSHVDNAGGADAARKLTQQRAEIVRDALVKLGIAKERIVAKGYGMDKPIAANTSEAGRAQNQRVEFVIAKRKVIAKASAVDVGDKIVALERLTEADGGAVDVTKIQGRWHVDMFVASSCKPCVDGIAMLDTRLANISIVAVDVTDDPAHLVDAAKLRRVHVLRAAQKDNPSVKRYAPDGKLPVTLIIDPDNVIRYRETGMGPKHFDQLAAAVAKLVPAAPKQSDAELANQANEAGKQLMYAGKFADASKKFRDAVAHGPTPVIYFNLCTSLFQEGKFGEALGACNSADSGADANLKPKIAKLAARIREEAKNQHLQVEPPH